GTARIVPGDSVQFGAGGPEFIFDLEPRPQQYMKTTRIAGESTAAYGSSGPPPTRTGGSLPQVIPPTAAGVPPSVGKATVEGMIMNSQSQSKKSSLLFLVIGGALLMIVIVAVAGVLYWNSMQSKKELSGEIGATRSAVAAAEAGKPMTPAEIATAHTNAVVYV